jgi:hypothetical protein
MKRNRHKLEVLVECHWVTCQTQNVKSIVSWSLPLKMLWILVRYRPQPFWATFTIPHTAFKHGAGIIYKL